MFYMPILLGVIQMSSAPQMLRDEPTDPPYTDG
jgi:hypothetical protein